MVEKEFGPLRSRAARKPWPECPDIVIYRCSHCDRLYQALSYDVPTQNPACCDAAMEELKPLQLGDVSPEINVDYQIVGGHNQNAVQVFWETKQPEDNPEWVLLKTFTGSYIKYVSSKKRPPMVFPLSDEDAYVYCDEDPCLQCVFRCKRGFIIYVYFKTMGLLEVPLEKMSANY
ncbi:hypothetical protein [Bacillus sp. 1NLA3E]|uniref:hypothetical protein n=1 Tax=Bacillus sp. 1NLA3E TaxID=666686 RepID=UPI000247E6D3|nr:hypothetical protein [Bacillus sp. 1NLA3E]AGK53274.1 hypothetical protein B1NLA3E_07560 [Bacillus sp. 1NLA3E]